MRNKSRREQVSVSTLAELETNPENSIPFGFSSIEGGCFDHIIHFKRVPYSEEFIRNMIKEYLADCMKNGKRIKPRTFFRSRGVSIATIYRWRQKFPFFNEMYIQGLDAIGDRREERGLTKQYDTNAIVRSMPMYDPDWKALREWEATLAEKEFETKNAKQAILRNWGNEVEKHEQLVKEDDENDHKTTDGTDRGLDVGDEHTKAAI